MDDEDYVDLFLSLLGFGFTVFIVLGFLGILIAIIML